MTSFRWGAASDTGRIREANEDNVVALDGLFVVADGMGGHLGGETASQMAVETLADHHRASKGTWPTAAVVKAVEDANARIVARASTDAELNGMGTTLCAIAAVESKGRDLLAVVNVGDSRAYLMSGGELRQLTEDHSLVASLERQGRLTPAEAAIHPQRNILTRALGIEDRVSVDSWEIEPRIGDRFVVCSDGLFNELDDPRIASTLNRFTDPREAAAELVRLANGRGGRDNITVVVVDVVDPSADAAGEGPPPAASGAASAADRTGADLGAAPGAPQPDRPSGAPGTVGLEQKRRRILTWRVGAFVAALVLILAAAAGAVGYAATRTYFVAFDGDEVVLFQGRPGGVLWIQPSIEERTDLARDDLSASAANDVEANKSFSSLDEADAYLANLADQTTTTTTTSTTTSTTSTTSTTAPPPPAGPAPAAP